MAERKGVTLNREVEATLIPSGEKVNVEAGTHVMITQSLGGTFTVSTDRGMLLSIKGQDADALGKKPEDAGGLTASDLASQPVDKLVWKQLRTCFNPEIPHNIVDLGLIYDCKITPFAGSETDKQVDIKMTLTAPGCGMGDWLAQDVQNKVLQVPTVKRVNVAIVFDPPWDRTKISDALRREMNLL